MNHAHLDCPKIKKHLALYAGRDLEAPLCVEVERHLAECESCRVELARANAARERIAVLGMQTALELEKAELWPALSERLMKERASAAAAAAALGAAPRVSARPARRNWIPISLAAAAALLVALGWGLFSKGTSPSLAPKADPAAGGVVSGTPIDAEPVSNFPSIDGGLRRATPEDERLRDSSLPLELELRPWLKRGAPPTPNSLAGDNELR